MPVLGYLVGELVCRSARLWLGDFLKRPHNLQVEMVAIYVQRKSVTVHVGEKLPGVFGRKRFIERTRRHTASLKGLVDANVLSLNG